MAQSKKNAFQLSENELAAFAKAISHPARIEILKTIAARQTCICGEIVEVMPLAQSTVSQHLKELLKAGLIQGTVDGTKSCYCIDHETFAAFEQSFLRFFNTATPSPDKECC